MKINKLILTAMIALVCNFAFAQSFFVPTTYRGAFAPAPAAMWTAGWTNWDPQNATYPSADVVITSNVTSNTTWTSNHTYLLQGQIYVTSGATLTIQAGTKILGDKNTVGAGLFISKGGKINAVGTATNPIVFTSNQPKGQRNIGDWGGVILMGKAHTNNPGDTNHIEGIAPNPYTLYGGQDDNDNSGTMQFCRIEFGGYVYQPNKEINGLTFGGVGRGTTIDHIQVSFSNDDAFEWFGGSVNCRYLVAYRSLDDDWDTDNGFSGHVQFCLSVRDPQIADNPAISTSEGFESDNDPNGDAATPKTTAIFSNITLIGPKRGNPSSTIAVGFKRVARIRRNSELRVYNCVALSYLNGLHIDGSLCETNATNGLTSTSPYLRFAYNILAGITGTWYERNSGSTFNVRKYFHDAHNDSTAEAGLLTNPFPTNYSTADYRPAAGSLALSGANFTDATFNGLVMFAPVAVDTIHICKLATAPTLTATALSGCTLKWYTTATTTVFTTVPPTVSNTATKTYYVSQINSLGIESPRKAITVYVDPLAATPAKIYGQVVDICYGTTYKYYAAAAANAVSYSWSVPVNATLVSTSGAKGDTAYISFSSPYLTGLISVRASNNCNASSARVLKIVAKPSMPSSVTGPLMVCAKLGDSINLATYTVTPVAGYPNYTWTAPAGATIFNGQGTTTASIFFSHSFTTGNISVATQGNCQSSAAKTIKPFVKPVVATANVISGPTSFCGVTHNSNDGFATMGYKMAHVDGATAYSWVTPQGASLLDGQGTDTATIRYSKGTFVSGSAIKCYAVNSCATSTTFASLAITVNTGCRMRNTNNNSTEETTSTVTTLFPNPASTQFTVRYTAESSKEIMISVYDVLGRKVSESKNSVMEGSNSIVVDCEKFNAGVYTVKVTDLTNNTTEALQLVK